MRASKIAGLAFAVMTAACGGAATPAAAPAPACAPCPPCASGSIEAAAEPAPRPRLRSTTGAELPDGAWKEVALDTIVLHFVEEHAVDADRFRAYLLDVHAALVNAFPGHDIKGTMTDPACHVWLMPAVTSLATPGRANAVTRYGKAPACDIYFVSPSALSDAERCCTTVGDRRDENSDRRTVAHEYGGVLLERLNRRHAAWRFGSAPSWFVQGYEEYLGVTLSGDRNRTVTFEKYRDLVRKDPSRIGHFGVANEYTDGAVLLAFLHDEFGAAKVQSVLMSKEKTFAAALRAELSVDPDALLRRFRAWQKRTLGTK